VILGHAFTAPPVSYVVTVPGPHGALPALLGEVIIAMLMMGMIQGLAPHVRLARFTGLCAGLMICAFVTIESPWSGFGMNPARTLASALPSGIVTALWVYLLAPPLGMLLVVECTRRWSRQPIRCCKLHHSRHEWCIFCGHAWRDRADA
jgi:aquaporin Z